MRHQYGRSTLKATRPLDLRRTESGRREPARAARRTRAWGKSMSPIPCVAAVFLATLHPIPGPPAGDRAADEAAIRAASAAFTAAFNKADADTLAKLFADDARAIDPDEALDGRDAIAARLAERFEAETGATMEATIDSIRFLTDDVAVEDGRATIRSADGVEANAYTVTYVRRDGRWLVAELRDLPERPLDLAPRERLEELAWLIGDWVDETDDATVETFCDWSEDGNYLIRTYALKLGSRAALKGTQRIGWDARRKQFRSWAFDDAGGFAEGFWSRDDTGRWVVKLSGTTPDGEAVSSTQAYTPLHGHVILFESYDLTRGARLIDEPIAVRLVHRPPTPTAGDAPTPTRREQP